MSATVLVPERSLEQRRQALVAANATRIERADMKRKIRTLDTANGATLVAGLLGSPKLESMLLVELLSSIWRYGDGKTDKLLRRLEVSPRKRIGGLSARQRELIVRELLDHATKCRTDQTGVH